VNAQLISAALIAVCAVIPSAAFAKSGYMTCQLYKEAGNPRTYYTYPFAADSADEDAMTSKFQRVSIASGMLQTTDQTIGGCHWEQKKDDAFRVVKGFMAKYRGNEFVFSRALALDGK
jgi:hypothetical protein